MFKTILLIGVLIQNTHGFLTNNNGFRQIFFNPKKEPCSDDKKLRYIIDIDGTICTKTKSDYLKTKPIYKNINLFNDLYYQGHEIHYWTARGALSGKVWDWVTICQLRAWNVKYDYLNMVKPHNDVWIDDKAINAYDFVKENENNDPIFKS